MNPSQMSATVRSVSSVVVMVCLSFVCVFVLAATTFAKAAVVKKDAKSAKRGNVRVLYKGHNVILGAKAKAAIERRGIEVRTIPDYYYPELED